MNMIDAILIGIVTGFFLTGFIRGFLRQVLEVACFIIAAAAAYVYYKNNGSLLRITLVFALTNLGLGAVFWGLLKLLRKKGEKLSFTSRFAGALIGGFEGIIFALVTVVFLHFLSGAIAAANPHIAERLEASFFYTRYKAISLACNVPVVKETYRMGELLKGKRIALEPQAVSQLEQNPSIKAALEDKQLAESIKQRDYAKIITHPKFLKILDDRRLVKQLVAIGLERSSPVVTEDKINEPEASQPEQAGNLLEGIVYSRELVAAVINGAIYRLGSEVCGGKIVEITRDTMTLEFPDRRKNYYIGEDVP